MINFNITSKLINTFVLHFFGFNFLMRTATNLFTLLNTSSKAIVIAIVLLFSAFLMSAQEKEKVKGGIISGRIIDSLSLQPVVYASISLLNQDDNKVVNGITTDDKGEFVLTGVLEGKYKMLVYFVGYKTGTINNIVVNKSYSTTNVGDVVLTSTETNLKVVEVTTDKNLIENHIDKMVYNAEKDVTSQGGVASDMLKKIPQVEVDVDGNVELQGNSNIRFLINGKPSTLFGNNIADVLQSIPANQIQSIEVITSPGAKYDAEGTGGIINIILKKVTAQGVNGNVSLSGGTRFESGNVNINARKGKVGVNAYFSGNGMLTSQTLLETDRTSWDPSTNQTTNFTQSGATNYNRGGFNSGIGFDWEVSKRDNFNASINYNYFTNHSDGTSNRQSVVNDASGNIISNLKDGIANVNDFYANSFDWSASYKRTFRKEGQELNVLYTSSLGKNNLSFSQKENYIMPDTVYSGTSGKNPLTNQETNIEINYTQPLPKDVVLEMGAKTVINQITSESDMFLWNTYSDIFIVSPNLSSSLNYSRNIYAGYLSASFKLFKWLDVKAGCRDEYTESNAFFSNSGNITFNPYNTIVPSIVVSHTFKKNQTLKIAYNHRIERPNYRDLNPFVNTSDPQNITTGNPNLRPEIGDKIELTYTKIFDKGSSINVVLFYRGNRDDIQSFVTYYPNYVIGDSTYHNVAVTSRENVGREDNYGLNIYGSIPITKKINFRTNISLFERFITNGDLAGNNIQGFNYRINGNLTYEVTETLIIEAFGNFNSPRTNVQGKVPSYTTYSLALRKQFFYKKFSVALTANNFIDKYMNQKTELTGDNFTLYALRQMPFRSFGINLTYKFGKMEFKKQKEEEDVNQGPQGN